MNVLLDAATTLIILATIWLSYRRGLLHTVIGLVGYVLSVLAAFALSAPLGSWIYTHLLKNLMLTHIDSLLTGQTLSSFMEALGQSASTQFFSGINVSSLFSSGGQTGGVMATATVNSIGPAIGRGIAFLILFFLFIAAVHILENLSTAVSRVPVLGPLNRIGGAVIGIAKACLIMFVICTVLSALLPALTLAHFPITASVINQTTVFKFFYQSNPLSKIL